MYSSKAQIVYDQTDRTVYQFLERLGQKGIIDFDELIKPLSRKYISMKLLEAKSKLESLTELEKEELEFLEKDYFIEFEELNQKNADIKYLDYFGNDPMRRFRIFSYSDKAFKMVSNPLVGFKLTYPERNRNLCTWMGLRTYGYLMDNIGINLEFKSFNEKGTGIDVSRIFTPETGILPEVHDKGKDIGYSEVNASISLDWDWGNLIIAKDFIEYGYAKFGNIVLSNKAPSFPYIRIELKPVDWFCFNYFHAWLSSTIIDSVKLNAYNRDIFRNKFFAWHALNITPLNGLDISIGESVIYSDQLELLYLLPIMFFYPADEYVSNRHGKPGDANQQIFLSVSSKNHVKNTHLFGTLFIDELTVGGINGTVLINTNYGGATSRRQRTQIGFTLGLSTTDLPIENLSFSTEYTRINPFVYGHHDTAQTYRSSGYLMGHWMGHNSDLIYMNLNYRFLRGLQAELWGAYLRHGDQSYGNQYTYPSQEFLTGEVGKRINYTYLGVNIRCELIHELLFDARLKLTKISSEQVDGSFKNDNIKEFSFSINYGL